MSCKSTKILISCLLALVFFSCKKNNTAAREIKTKIIVKDSIKNNNEPQLIPIDTLLTELANFIAVTNLPKSSYGSKIGESFWEKIKKETDENFKKAEDTRLFKIKNWDFKEYLNSKNDTLPLFYPFSGSDFLHVNYLYPNTNTYVLTAIEKIGTLPDFIKRSSKSCQKYLKDINYFMRDISGERGYFITSRMKDDIEESSVDGLLGSLLWFIARTNHEIISLEYVTIDKSGNIINETEPSQGWLKEDYDGVRFILKDKNQNNKNLIYFSADISDKGLRKKNPTLKLYFDKMGPVNTFVKSASYLMHYDSFELIRNVVLEKSNSIFQDDTGVPFRFFDNKVFNVSLFGRYVDPIKDFESTMDIITQEDLRSAYKNKKINKGYLPFSLGYHWRNSKKQNQQFAIRKN